MNKKLIGIFILIALTSNLFYGTINAEPLTDWNIIQNVATCGYTITDTDGIMGQSFITPNNAGTINQIDLNFDTRGHGNTDFLVGIDNSLNPNGPWLYSLQIYSVNSYNGWYSIYVDWSITDNTQYYLFIKATDGGGTIRCGDDNYGGGILYIFSVGVPNPPQPNFDLAFRLFGNYGQGNQPPNTPSNPSPSNGATGVSINADLSWTGGDPDGDTVVYDVYFGTSSPPPYKITTTQETYDPGQMEHNTKYYWKIKAIDEHGAETNGPEWSFHTEDEPNLPPYAPSNPSPSDYETNVDVNSDISWTGGDPNPGDTVVYDIFIGKSSNDFNLVCKDFEHTIFDPGTFEFNKHYYWKIKAKDNHGDITYSDIWEFHTENFDGTNLPDLNFPITTKSKIGKFYFGTDLGGWTLNEGFNYPISYGYETNSNLPKKEAYSGLYDIHNGAKIPLTGVGFPERHDLSTFIGHSYKIPSCGNEWEQTPPCKIKLSGKYAINGLAGFMARNYIASAFIDITLTIKWEDCDREIKLLIAHDEISGISFDPKTEKTIQGQDFIKLFPGYITFLYGHTYSFYLEARASIVTTSQGLPINPFASLPSANFWAFSAIGASLDYIELIWQPSLDGGNNHPPNQPGETYGSKGIVNEEHIFYSNGSIDPDGDQLYYRWHWGDGTSTDWLGPNDSGEPISLSHTYTKPGIFNVQVEAKDINNSWSGLSNNSYCEMYFPEGKIIVDRPYEGQQISPPVPFHPNPPMEIKWRKSGFTGDYVSIALYKGIGNGEYEYIRHISGKTPNTGSEVWSVVYSCDGYGKDYRIVVSDMMNAANCTGSFEILKQTPRTRNTFLESIKVLINRFPILQKLINLLSRLSNIPDIK